MKTRSFSVRAGGDSYPFTLGSNLGQELGNAVAKYPKHRIAIISDSTVAGLYGEQVVAMLAGINRPATLLPFPAGEINKNRNTVFSLQDQLDTGGFNRDSLLIALGGGVVGDVTGLLGGIHVRGVPFIQVPTTLLAMIDSSIGGKVGVDTPGGKNRVGLFYQPRAVIADMRFLSTLSTEQMLNGFFEALKLFLISDKTSLDLCLQFGPDELLGSPSLLQDIILLSVRGKARVVERDEKEENERRMLNSGHTIGHSVESLSEYRLLHGFCVAYGMLAEAKIAELLGVLSSQDYEHIVRILASFGIRGSEFPKFPINDIIAKTRGDKKTRSGQPQYVLPSGIGSVYAAGGEYAHPVDDEIVRKALTSLV